MSATATLEVPHISVDPGAAVVVPLSIRNHGTLVEGYRFEVVGVPAQWATVDPPEVSLYPGDSATAVVTIRPPRTSAVPAGEQPYGVRVVPTERPEETIVPEGMVVVLPFLDTTAELIPRTSHGRGGAKHQVAVDNRGNVPITAVFDAVDPAEALALDIDPGLSVGPGNAAFVDLKVKPVKRLWRGQPITHQFAVHVTPHDGPPVALDGTHLQEPTIPKWLPKALLALLALIALLVALWYLVLKPAVKSAAKDAAKQAIAGPVDKAQKQAQAAGQQAAAAQNAVKAVASGRPIPTRTAAPTTVSVPLNRRLVVTTPANTQADTSYDVPGRNTAKITDIVLENPQGDFGTLTISHGSSVLFVLSLENFRDIDYHFVSPIVIGGGQSLTASTTCRRVGTPVGSTPTTCLSSVLIGGTLTRPNG